VNYKPIQNKIRGQLYRVPALKDYVFRIEQHMTGVRIRVNGNGKSRVANLEHKVPDRKMENEILSKVINMVFGLDVKNQLAPVMDIKIKEPEVREVSDDLFEEDRKVDL
jgi:hypothetical protein